MALVGGPVAGLVVWGATGGGEAALGSAGRATAGVAAWMALWWLTEAVPLAVTALLPVALFPLLGAGSVRETTAPYAHPLIFLFLGGFLLGLALQRCGLHRRIALEVLRLAGTDSRRLVGAFMLATAVISMWISNTATTIMLLPIAVSLLGAVAERAGARPEVDARGHAHLATALLLGIAYASSIGGVATLIGTPPNLVLAGFLRERYGIEIGMTEWMRIGLPFTALFLPLAWLYLTRVACRAMPARLPGSAERIEAERRALGPLGRAERTVLAVFALTVAAWLARPWLAEATGLPGLTDPVIAMVAALVLFALPTAPRAGAFALDWETARRVPWEILILFGGGLTLADAIGRHGVDAWLAGALAPLAGAPPVVLVAAVATFVVFLTEITSNTAVTATLLPVLGASAASLGVAPEPLLVATALAASCAFMLPVATPPNAVVFSTGHVSIGRMARIGIALNVISVALVTSLVGLAGLAIAEVGRGAG